jgi:hypothetical protein
MTFLHYLLFFWKVTKNQHITIFLFDTTKTTRFALAKNMIDLLDQFGLKKKSLHM